MIKLNILAFFVLSMSVVFAQQATTGSGHGTGINIADQILMKDRDMAIAKAEGKDNESIEGTPYLDPTFINGNVLTESNAFKNVPIRYNIMDDVMEFKSRNLVYVLDPASHIIKVDINNDVFLVKKYNVKKDVKHGYFMLLDSGKLSILQKPSVTFKPGHAPAALESVATPDKFVRGKDSFFYQIGGGDLIEFSSVKAFLATLPNKKAETSAFIKDGKLSFKDRDDLLLLSRFYNSQ